MVRGPKGAAAGGFSPSSWCCPCSQVQACRSSRRFLGGLAFGRYATIWRVLGGFGFAGSVALLVLFNGSDGGTGLPVAMGYGGFLLLWLALAAGGSVLYRPQAWNREAVVRTSRQARRRRAGWRRAPHPKSSS